MIDILCTSSDNLVSHAISLVFRYFSVVVWFFFACCFAPSLYALSFIFRLIERLIGDRMRTSDSFKRTTTNSLLCRGWQILYFAFVSFIVAAAAVSATAAVGAMWYENVSFVFVCRRMNPYACVCSIGNHNKLFELRWEWSNLSLMSNTPRNSRNHIFERKQQNKNIIHFIVYRRLLCMICSTQCKNLKRTSRFNRRRQTDKKYLFSYRYFALITNESTVMSYRKNKFTPDK